MLRAYGLTDRGRLRPTNEDCFAVEADLDLCVVADGLGGHPAGEVAARLAVDGVVDAVRSAIHAEVPAWPFGYDPALSADGNLLRTAIHLASMQVVEAAVSVSAYAGMGTTIVAVRAAAGRLSVAHAGDSRLYLLSRGRLRQVTQDDSWLAAMMADNPAADRGALERHPMRGALTNAVGAMKRTIVHVVEQRLEGGEMLLLSTDGVHGVLDDRRLERMLSDVDDPRAIAETVVGEALARGSRDNCTAVVARYLS